MRATLITTGSVLLTTAVIGNAFYHKKQFYPSVVYVTKSNPSMAVSIHLKYTYEIDRQSKSLSNYFSLAPSHDN